MWTCYIPCVTISGMSFPYPQDPFLSIRSNLVFGSKHRKEMDSRRKNSQEKANSPSLKSSAHSLVSCWGGGGLYTYVHVI